MARSHKDQQQQFELGRLAGVAEEAARTINSEIVTLKQGQTAILAKIDTLSERVEQLNNWRWIVVGFASAVAFLISMFVGFFKGVFK